MLGVGTRSVFGREAKIKPTGMYSRRLLDPYPIVVTAFEYVGIVIATLFSKPHSLLYQGIDCDFVGRVSVYWFYAFLPLLLFQLPNA